MCGCLGVQGERALFQEAHKKCFGWMDEWCELTIDDVRKIEKENIENMRKVREQPGMQGPHSEYRGGLYRGPVFWLRRICSVNQC